MILRPMKLNAASRHRGCFNGLVSMFNWKIFLFPMLLVSPVAGCNSANKTFDYVKPEPVVENKLVKNKQAEKGSAVYVYRPAKMANVMLTPDLYIAGVEKIEIASGTYKKVYLEPGVYAVRLQAIEGNTEAVNHELEIIKGRVHYLRVDALMKVDAGQQGYQPYKRKFELKNVSAKKAKQEIAKCRNMDSVKKRKPVSSSEGENNNEDGASFSVDKTLNPFSH